MDKAKSALEKLRRIQELWLALERIGPNAPEYAGLVKQIHAMSSDYQTLIESLHKPDKTSN